MLSEDEYSCNNILSLVDFKHNRYVLGSHSLILMLIPISLFLYDSAVVDDISRCRVREIAGQHASHILYIICSCKIIVQCTYVAVIVLLHTLRGSDNSYGST